MSFDVRLAREIIALIDGGLQGKYPLPYDDHATLTRLVINGGNTLDNFDHTIKTLHALHVLKARRYAIEHDLNVVFSLTSEGAKAFSEGGTLRQKLCELLANQPEDTMEIGNIKNEKPFSELSLKKRDNLIADAIAARYVKKCHGKEMPERLTLLEGASYKEDSQFLKEINEHGCLLTNGETQKKFLCSSLVEKRSIVRVPAYKINPGKNFGTDLSFEGIDGSLPRKPDNPTFSYKSPSPDAFKDFYTKVYLLSLVMKGSPPSERKGRETVFVQQGPVQLSEFWWIRAKVDLPLADSLALFFVKHPQSDVAAATITYPAAGHAHVFIAKNLVVEDDSMHAMMLLGLMSGDLKKRHGGFHSFATHGLTKVLLPYCRKKIEQRLRDVDTDQLAKYAEALLETGLSDASLAAREPNLDELTPRLHKETRCETILELIRIIIDYCKAIDTEDEARTMQVMLYVYVLYNSRTFRTAYADWVSSTGISDRVLDNLRKVGEYCGGLRLLWRALTSRCIITGAATKPFKLDVTVIPSVPTVKIQLRTDWYQMLNDFSLSPSGGRMPLDVSEKAFLEAWSSAPNKDSLPIPAELDTNYHCELALTDYLRWNGHERAVIGVSKHSCQLCSVALAYRNLLGENWLLSNGHHQVYQSLLPNFHNTDVDLAHNVTKHLVDVVDNYILTEIASVRVANQSPTLPIHQEFEEVGEGEEYDSLFD